MNKCPECHCLTSASQKLSYHMTYCSKYNAKADGYPRKEKK